jgi:hypothetical protein
MVSCFRLAETHARVRFTPLLHAMKVIVGPLLT